MASVKYVANDSSYIELATEDSIIENKSSYIVRLVVAESKPAADTEDFYALRPNEHFIKRKGLPLGNVYALCENKNQTATIAVSDGLFEQATDRDLLEAILLELTFLRTMSGEAYQSSLTRDDIESDQLCE